MPPACSIDVVMVPPSLARRQAHVTWAVRAARKVANAGASAGLLALVVWALAAEPVRADDGRDSRASVECAGDGPDRAATAETDPASTADPAAAAETSETPAPKVIGDAWRNGRAEVDEGQGLIGQLTPGGVDWLAERGVQFFGWYMVALQGNPVGGLDRNFAYAGLFDFGLDLDMETMAGIPGLWVHASGSSAHGYNLTNDVGAFAPVNAVYSGNSVRLFELYLEERILDDLLSIRLGRISVGWEYGLEYDYFTQYISAVFRLNVFSLDVATPNFTVIPTANWGARVRLTPDAHWRVQASWMNGYPRDFGDDDQHGVDFTLQPQKGSFFILETSYQWLPTEQERRNARGLPGRVTFGGYYDTGSFDELNGSGETDRVLGVGYLILRQKLWEPAAGSSRGLVGWASGTVGGKTTLVSMPYFCSGGLVWEGPFKRLKDDTLAVGFANQIFSNQLPGQSFETVLELAYSFNVTTWITLMPDLQYIVRPGGIESADGALVMGLHVYLTL